jgi:hypothetical protein
LRLENRASSRFILISIGGLLVNAEQQLKQFGQIVAKAWQDDAFKKRLLANPSAVLKEQGLEVPKGTEIRVVENTDQIVHLTIPAKPREGELSHDDLEKVAGGLTALTTIVRILSPVFGWTLGQERQITAEDKVPDPWHTPPGPA